VAEARSTQAGKKTFIFNQKLSGKVDSMSYSLPEKLRLFTIEATVYSNVNC